MGNLKEICDANKAVVRRFNREVIEQGSAAAFRELVAPHFVDRSAPPGVPTGPEGLSYVFNQILRPALPDLTVEIQLQVAEGDLVTTRKMIRGTHRGALLGVPATNTQIEISVIDIVRIEAGRYVEHWGVNTLPSVLQALALPSVLQAVGGT